MAIEDLVRANYGKLNENDLYIWKYIDTHREECSHATIEELAKNCNVSRTTILRFAKKLSMEGFSELKIHMKMELEKNAKKFMKQNIYMFMVPVRFSPLSPGSLKGHSFRQKCA